MSRRFYFITAIFTDIALLICLIQQIVVKNWWGVVANVVWLFANSSCYAVLNRAETIKKFVDEKLDEHEERNNESEN